MAAMIFMLIVVGFNMGGAPDDMKPFLYRIHKAFGITVLLLVFVRLLFRFCTTVPKMPDNSFLNRIAKVVHWLLYLTMFSIPISGYVISSASGKPISWFFGIDIPLFIDKSVEITGYASTMHLLGVRIFIVMILLHFLGTLKHLVINKENILKRIW